jgi:hypothetical protein
MAAFNFLDRNKDKRLGKKDTKPLRKMLRKDANFTKAGLKYIYPLI